MSVAARILVFLCVAAGASVAGFVVARKAKPVAAPASVPVAVDDPAPVPERAPRQVVALKPVRLSAPAVHVKAMKAPAPKHASAAGGALPHKATATDSRALALPVAAHETGSAPPSSDEEQKQEASAQFDADSIRLVVRAHLAQVRACYARAFKDASPGGAVEIGFAIDGGGRAARVRTETNTTDSEALARCLEERVKQWQFPRPIGADYELIYPFVFAPGS